MKCLLAIVGPTAVGKSNLSIQIAQRYNGEIINADSRQIYRYMDIGTAKPTVNDLDLVPHHIVDIILPDESYSVALYKRSALETINNVQFKGKLPIIVGGSGQYIWSVIEDWSIPEVEPNLEFREMLAAQAAKSGTLKLFEKLAAIDPEIADRMQPHNLRRIIRALEIYAATGVKPSQIRSKHGLPYPVLLIGLTAARDRLYDLINHRVNEMIVQGLIDEVLNLLKMGYSLRLPSMSSIGYKQIGMYLNGEFNLEEAIERIKFETHRFARGQYVWFKLNDTRIKWFDVGDDTENKVNYTIETFLNDLRE